jgi:hypothetical protein
LQARQWTIARHPIRRFADSAPSANRQCTVEEPQQ